MPTYTGNQPPAANTGAGIAAQIAAHQLWEKGALLFEQTEDFFNQFEGGENSKSIVIAKTDTAKGAGQKITFKARAGFYGEGKRRDETFDEKDDFESVKMDDFDLVIDWVRNATRYTERSEELVGIRGELEDGLPEELGSWLGRKKTEEIFMTCLHRLNGENRSYAGSKTAATLLSGDVFLWNEILSLERWRSAMAGRRRGLARGSRWEAEG